jgi:hypothetical protein
VRTTGARRPENAKKDNAIAPTNTISRTDVERHARFTEANGLPRPVAKTYSRKKPHVSRGSLDLSALARWASAVRPELQGFSPPPDQNAYRCGYYSHEIESRQACSEAATPSPFFVEVFIPRWLCWRCLQVLIVDLEAGAESAQGGFGMARFSDRLRAPSKRKTDAISFEISAGSGSFVGEGINFLARIDKAPTPPASSRNWPSSSLTHE